MQVTPLRMASASKHYTVVCYNGTKLTALRKDIFKITRSRFVFSVRFIQELENQQTPYNQRDHFTAILERDRNDNNDNNNNDNVNNQNKDINSQSGEENSRSGTDPYESSSTRSSNSGQSGRSRRRRKKKKSGPKSRPKVLSNGDGVKAEGDLSENDEHVHRISVSEISEAEEQELNCSRESKLSFFDDDDNGNDNNNDNDSGTNINNNGNNNNINNNNNNEISTKLNEFELKMKEVEEQKAVLERLEERLKANEEKQKEQQNLLEKQCFDLQQAQQRFLEKQVQQQQQVKLIYWFKLLQVLCFASINFHMNSSEF